MRKIKTVILSSISFLLLTPALTSCGEKSTTVSNKEWLDRYEEKVITLEGVSNPETLSWKSLDNNVVSINNGKLIAEGVGETTVTSSIRGHKYVIEVKVFDSGVSPTIRLEEDTFYKDVTTVIEPYISYNGDKYTPNITYNFESSNESILKIDGLNVTGKSEGITSLKVRASYKGLDLSKRFNVTVKPNSYVELIEDDEAIDNFKIYACENTKFSSKNLTFNLIDNGVKVENPLMNYTVQDKSIVKFENNIAIALKQGKTKVVAAYSKKESVHVEFEVEVLPNYVEESFSNDVSASYGVIYTPYDGTVGSRTGSFMKFYNGDLMHNDDKESYWNHRLVNKSSGQNAIEAYRSYGYRYFAFDIYMDKPARFLAMLDGSYKTYYSEYDVYFKNDIVSIIGENGKFINKIVANQWLTIVYDIKARIELEPDSNLNFSLALNADGLTSYLTNIRYYMDSSFMPMSELSYTKINDDEVQATNDEFVQKHLNNNVYEKVEKEVSGVMNPHMLKTNSNNYVNDTLVIASSTGTSKADSLTRLQSHGNYLAFDLYVEKASKLYFSINGEKLNFVASVGVTNFSKCSWLTLTSNGKIEYALKLNKWYTIYVDFSSEKMRNEFASDPNTANSVNIQFNACSTGDIVYLNNLRYLKSDKSIPNEFAEPLLTTNTTSLLVNKGQKFKIDASVINGTTLSIIRFKVENSNIVAAQDNNGEFLAKNMGNTTITVTCGNLIPVSVEIRIVDSFNYNSTIQATYRDASVGGLDDYMKYNHLTISRDDKEMKQSGIVKFDFTVTQAFNYLYLVDTAGRADPGLIATRIGPNEYNGAEWWGAATSGAPSNILSICDENNNVLGVFGKEGITFEEGKTYTVYYSLSQGRDLDIFVSQLGLTKQKEDFYWGDSDYSYLSPVDDYISVFNIGGTYSDVTPSIDVKNKDLTILAGEEKEIDYSILFGNGKLVSISSSNKEIVNVKDNKIVGVNAGTTTVNVSIEGGNTVTINVNVKDGFIDVEDVIQGTVNGNKTLPLNVSNSLTTREVTYVSNDPSVVSVNGNVLSFIKKGYTTVKASASGCDDVTFGVRVINDNKVALTDTFNLDSDYPSNTRLLFNKTSSEAQNHDTIQFDLTVKESFNYLYILDKNLLDPNQAQYENAVKIGNGGNGSMYQGLTSWWVPNYTAGFDASYLTITNSNGKVLGKLGTNPSAFNRVGEGFSFEKGQTYNFTINLSNNHQLILLCADFMKTVNNGNDHDEVCGGNITNYMKNISNCLEITNIYGL